MKIVIDIPDKAYGIIKYFESALDSNYEKEDKDHIDKSCA